MKKIFAVILSLLLLMACADSSRVAETLAVAERDMDARPDSVLELLRSLPADSIGDDRDRALYALMLSRALDKNYVDLTDDSIIAVAVDYFSDADEPRYEMLSQFYLGRVKFNARDYSGSLVAMFKALELARQIDDPFWIAMAAKEIGNIYKIAYNATESIVYYKLALDKFIESGNDRFLDFALYSYVKALNNCKKYDSCLIVADAVLNPQSNGYKGYHVKSPKWKHSVRQAVGVSLYAHEKFDDAALRFKELANSENATFEDSAWYALAYIRSGNPDLSHIKKIVETAENDSDLLVCELKHQYFLAKGVLSEALKYINLADNHVGKELVSRVYQDLSTSVIKQYENEKNEKQKIIERNRFIATATIISIIIIVGLLITYIVRRLKIQRETILNNVEIVEDLRRTLSIKDSEIVSAQNSVKKLLADRYTYFDELCRVYYENPEAGSAKKISDELSKFINEITSEQHISKLENLINSYHSDILIKLRTDLPRLSREDYLLVLFTILGFSSNAIALFLKVDKITAIYDRRKYLKQRIRKLDDAKKLLYLSIFKSIPK